MQATFHPRTWFIRRAVVPIVLALIPTAASGQDFTVPAGAATAAWEAELARAATTWIRTEHSQAGGGVYLTAAGSNEPKTLEFPFEVERPTTIRIWPKWWDTSSKRPAKPFGHPREPKFGPERIACIGDHAYFTCPAAGAVGIVDVPSEKLIGQLRLGGYPTDLIADPTKNAVYVADAQGNRVIVLSAADQKVAAQISVADGPTSMALDGDRLFVACESGSTVEIIDTVALAKSRTIPLERSPMRIAVSEDSKRLIVWSKPSTFDALTLEPRPPSKEAYSFGGRTLIRLDGSRSRTEVRLDTNNLRVTVRKRVGTAWKADPTRTIDISAITQFEQLKDRLPRTMATQRPNSAFNFGSAIFFNAPKAGKIGVFDASGNDKLSSIDVGGYVIDMALDPLNKRLFVADAAGNRVVVIDVDGRKIAQTVNVPAGPWSLTLSGSELLVACRHAGQIAVIETSTGKVARTIDAGGKPLAIQTQSRPNIGWWPLMSDAEIVEALEPPIAVLMAPVAFNLPGLDPAASHGASATPEPLPSTVTWASGDKKKTLTASGELVLGIDQRWIDVGLVADPNLLPHPKPLAPTQQRGTVTFALDDGPEVDWTRNIWVTPDQGTFLVSETEEFRRWNAPTFTLQPGKHVIKVKAHDKHAALDSLQVTRSLRDRVNLRVTTEPENSSGGSGAPGEHAVFYADESGQARIVLTSLTDENQDFRLRATLRDYMDAAITVIDSRIVLGPRETTTRSIRIPIKHYGRIRLDADLSSSDGRMVRNAWFLRVPKLEHPRLLYRKDGESEIRARIAKYPRLFERYAAWLRRRFQEPGFLPSGLTKEVLRSHDQPDWRNYDLAWRMLGVQFASSFLDGEHREEFRNRIDELLSTESVPTYSTFHHHGPLFPGMAAAAFDVAARDSKEYQERTKKVFSQFMGNMDMFPTFLAALEEPLTTKDRAMLSEMLVWMVNFDRYFQTHHGSRAGLWWLNPRTGCNCLTSGYMASTLYLRNFLKEDRLFDKPYYKGIFTYIDYVSPRFDHQGLLGNSGPHGEPIRWIATALADHPLERQKYDFERIVRALNGPLGVNEDDAVDRLFEQFGSKNAAAVPIALALGWYEPDGERVKWEEMPPTALFDFEGTAVLRSDWNGGMTEVAFTSGARDHTSRHQPNHFRLMKAGEFLLGTASLFGDHGNPISSWGNVVVAGNDWPRRWSENLWHVRADELHVIHRFTPIIWPYIGRMQKAKGFFPAERGWGGGVNLHGHTESAFVREGKVIAYETAPVFDYVAGDASKAWTTDEISESIRQLVFIKPNIVVVHDRVATGPSGGNSYWLAATGPDLATSGQEFSIRSGSAALHGSTLLPARAQLKQHDSVSYKSLFERRQRVHQQVLEIHPPSASGRANYLIVLEVSLGNEVGRPIVKGDAGWRYLPLDLPESRVKIAGERWTQGSFDDGQWLTGAAPLGFGREPAAAITTPVQDGATEYLMRKSFTIDDPSKLSGLVLRVASDNAAIVYLNGKQVDRDPAYGHPLGHAARYWNREVAVSASQIRKGENVLAVRLKSGPGDRTAFFDAELAAQGPSVRTIEPQLVTGNETTGARFTYSGKQIEISFRTAGEVGGHIKIIGDGVEIDRPLVRQIDDNYRHWRDDPRYDSWLSDPRLAFIVGPHAQRGRVAVAP